MQANDKIALYIPSVNNSGDYRTLSPYFVRVDDKGKVRNIYCDDSPFEDLRFNCQWERDKETLYVYAWAMEYNGVTVRHSGTASRMAKMLRKIESIRQDMPVTPTTFGQYVTLYAAGLGVKMAAVPSKGTANFYDYSERNHTFLTIGADTQNYIDRLIAASWEADHPNTSTLALPASV